MTRGARRLGAIVFATLIGSASLGWAQLGQLLPSAHDQMVEACLDIVPFEPAAVYLLVAVDFAQDGRPTENAWNGLMQWEGAAIVPPLLTIMTANALPPTAVDEAPDLRNFVVTLGETLVSGGTFVPVARFWVAAFHHDDVSAEQIGVGPATPPTLGLDAPAWREAKDGSVHAFSALAAPLRLTCSTPGASLSWGRAKARF